MPRTPTFSKPCGSLALRYPPLSMLLLLLLLLQCDGVISRDNKPAWPRLRSGCMQEEETRALQHVRAWAAHA